MKRKAYIAVSVELFRQMLDLPDEIEIEFVSQAPMAHIGAPRQFEIHIASEHIDPSLGVVPKPPIRLIYDRVEVGNAELIRIDGYTGPLKPSAFNPS